MVHQIRLVHRAGLAAIFSATGFILYSLSEPNQGVDDGAHRRLQILHRLQIKDNIGKNNDIL